MLAAAGGAAVLAVTGAALGGQVADRSRPAAVGASTTADDRPPAAAGDDSPTTAADRAPTGTAAPGTAGAGGVDPRAAGTVA
ncbi:hypothetical protein LQ51_20350, partial [Micromonospora sp. HK10]